MLRQWELPKLISIGISPACGGILRLMPMHQNDIMIFVAKTVLMFIFSF